MLAIILSSGVYIIICALLRAHYSLGDITSFSNALTWADRECCVTAIMVSLPGIKPFFQNTHLLNWIACKRSRASLPGAGACDEFGFESPGQTRTFISSHCSGTPDRRFELDTVLWPSGNRNNGISGISAYDEEAYPNTGNEFSTAGRAASRAPEIQRPLMIHVTTMYTLESEHEESSSSRSDV